MCSSSFAMFDMLYSLKKSNYSSVFWVQGQPVFYYHVPSLEKINK